jgi:hypothetical protein
MGDDVFVDTEAFLVTDFINLKIKPAQSFGCAHRGRIYVWVSECSYVYEYLRLYCISKKTASKKFSFLCRADIRLVYVTRSGLIHLILISCISLTASSGILAIPYMS